MARSGNYQDTCCVWICPVIVIVLRFRSLRPKTHQAAFGSKIVLVSLDAMRRGDLCSRDMLPVGCGFLQLPTAIHPMSSTVVWTRSFAAAAT